MPTNTRVSRTSSWKPPTITNDATIFLGRGEPIGVPWHAKNSGDTAGIHLRKNLQKSNHCGKILCGQKFNANRSLISYQGDRVIRLFVEFIVFFGNNPQRKMMLELARWPWGDYSYGCVRMARYSRECKFGHHRRTKSFELFSRAHTWSHNAHWPRIVTRRTDILDGKLGGWRGQIKEEEQTCKRVAFAAL